MGYAKVIIVQCFLLLVLSGLASAAAVSAPVVDLGYAKYQGYVNTTSQVRYFMGIPYANPPVGDLRWAAPVPIEKNATYSNIASKSYQNATVAAPKCVQGNPYWYPSTSPTGSEDCLVLNVMTPVNANKLPVLVEIHGGGYTHGGADGGGGFLLHRSNNSMIYVSIQYRLGMFGFLGGKDIKSHGSLNAGLLDQRAALWWVKNHIEKFGGDPNKITISGGSAGGGSVSLQLTAYRGSASRPFERAFAEYPWWQPFVNATTQEAQYKAVLDLAKCDGIKCLRSLSESTLKAVSNASYFAGESLPQSDHGTFYYGPVIDGSFVYQSLSDSFKTGEFYDVPLMVDHAPYEGATFSYTELKAADGLEVSYKDAQQLFPSANTDFFTSVFELYPPSDYNSTFYQRGAWFGDAIIQCPTKYMAVGATNFNTNSSAVFKLLFAQGTQKHTASGPFIFSNYYPASVANQTVANILTSYVYSFIATGDPNVLRIPEAPFWPSYSTPNVSSTLPLNPMSYDTLHISYGGIDVIKDNEVGPKCDFFSANSYIVEN